MLLRVATPDDALSVARVHVRSWQAGYRNLLPAEYLDRLRAEDRAKRYNFETTDPSQPSTTVAVEGGAVVGFVTVAPAQDADAQGSGELCALYVDPDWWGRRLGCALIKQGRYRLLELGFQDAVLWVMLGNTRAERFYSGDGWNNEGMRRTASVWDTTVDEIRYRRQLAVDAVDA